MIDAQKPPDNRRLLCQKGRFAYVGRGLLSPPLPHPIQTAGASPRPTVKEKTYEFLQHPYWVWHCPLRKGDVCTRRFLSKRHGSIAAKSKSARSADLLLLSCVFWFSQQADGDGNQAHNLADNGTHCHIDDVINKPCGGADQTVNPDRIHTV